MLNHSRQIQHGFTLLEVLITLIIIAGALLGTAGMQAYGLKLTHGSQFRSQAVYLAYEMLERIEANNEGAKDINGPYIQDPIIGMGPAPSCDANLSACNGADLAKADLKQFETRLVATLPGVTAKISRVNNSPASPPAAKENMGPWTYTIDITWQQTAAKPKGTTSDTTVEKTETMTYSVTRTVHDRSSVL